MAAAFGANVNVTESVKSAGEVKPANASPVQQIADQVQMTLNRGENSATIRLQPAELGGVRIRMQVQDGQLHLSIEADKSGTGQLIDQQLGNLRQSLENSGMRIGDLAVLAGGRGQNGVEAMQREAAQQFRTLQMEMGSQQQQQQHAQKPQAAFAGQNGQQRQRGQFDPAQMLDGTSPAGIGAVNAAGMGGRNVWQTAAYAAVDYYA
jgi:flagellar hook-length control protein FliK